MAPRWLGLFLYLDRRRRIDTRIQTAADEPLWGEYLFWPTVEWWYFAGQTVLHPETKYRRDLVVDARGSERAFYVEIFLNSSWAAIDCLGCLEREVIQENPI